MVKKTVEEEEKMKTIEEYMAMPYRMEILPDKTEGGFIVSFPELPGCITIGKTIEEAIDSAYDAKLAWFSAAMEDHLIINEPQELEKYSGQFKLRLPKSLHKKLAIVAKNEGISMNQFCIYLLSKNL